MRAARRPRIPVTEIAIAFTGTICVLATLHASRPAAAQEQDEAVRQPAPDGTHAEGHDERAAPSPAEDGQDAREAAMPPGPLGAPQAREGSGTAWLPDASPMFNYPARIGDWLFMMHGNLFVYYIDQEADGRGDREFGSINWFMPMITGPFAGGELGARVMLSLEPLTVPGCGYPDLLATGEVCDGELIIDEQHPHDLLMELAAEFEREITQDVGFQIYGGLVGEPALGPVAYPHRFSAFPNPIAPITHHWFDATHISFGVITAGVFGRSWKIEGSIFNGREPDDERLDLDLGPLDSFAGRISLLPSERWAIQVSAGRLEEAEPVLEPAHGRIDLWRATASVTFHQPLSAESFGAVTAGWAMNDEQGEAATHAALAETAWYLGRNVLFGRAELVQKEAHDLGIETAEETFEVAKFELGYVREIGTLLGLVPGVGGAVSFSVLPDGLEPTYGTRNPVGFAVFVNLRPDAMHGVHGAGPHEPLPDAPH